MADEVKRIEVDIGAAAEMLQSSPELCAMMNEMVGGPALVEAQAEVERLRALLFKIQCNQLDYATTGRSHLALRRNAMRTRNEIAAALGE
jgi:hypothetical protein